MEYFKNMFKNIDDNIVLDEEQIEIIKNNDDNLMVIAGAGSGKTTTISAKVNYLIEKQNIKDEEILVISFTNKAVKELDKSINKDFHHNVKVETFHKLGYDIIKENSKIPPKIIKEPDKIIKNYIEQNIVNNKQQLKKFMELFIYYFNIDESINLFKSYDKYFLFKNKQKYQTLKQKVQFIEQELNKEEIVYTKEEQLISNYLYLNNITYKYQEPYNKNYTPDFTIYQDHEKYYIEYFNMSKIKKFKYEKNINKIRKIHKKNHLIEIYNNDIIDNLDKQIGKFGIKKDNKNINKIFENLILKNKDKSYSKFIDFSKTFISLFKAKGLCNFKSLNNTTKRDIMFIEYIENLYNYYEEYLLKTNQIDFDDMINKATKIVKEKVNLKYKYIIIDEYQDISNNRFELIKAIKEQINNKLMVVGDDWQCIYKFTSSNINLFTHFKNYVGNCTTLKITKTYRNSQQLIDIAGTFVKQNKYQINKNLISKKNLNYPITILKYKSNKIEKKLIEALDYLIKKYQNKNILILGRYTFDLNMIKNNLITEKNQHIIYKNSPNTQIDYMTAHASKGLGYDNVIIINAINDTLGFPSKIKNDPIIDQLLEKDEIKYAEERRLFYVALTRTKNEVIILTPSDKQSEFITEIKKYKQVKKCHILT